MWSELELQRRGPKVVWISFGAGDPEMSGVSMDRPKTCGPEVSLRTKEQQQVELQPSSEV